MFYYLNVCSTIKKNLWMETTTSWEEVRVEVVFFLKYYFFHRKKYFESTYKSQYFVS